MVSQQFPKLKKLSFEFASNLGSSVCDSASSTALLCELLQLGDRASETPWATQSTCTVQQLAKRESERTFSAKFAKLSDGRGIAA